jgi:hypothetical protein
MGTKSLILSVTYETETITDLNSIKYPLRILDGGVIYRCDNLSQFCEWLEDKEGALQEHVTEYDRVIDVKEVEDTGNGEK